ncbi:MAG TPA: DUF1203 domain-containing protein [Candidatus Eisenbacteria bacterium]|jgi:hypothetical protein|nr:DUF1203 domain-containing protein [Candidatus Eisenbacteria bacterium]
MNYRVRGLSPDLFESLFEMGDAELAERGAVRRVADEPHAYPCRVSLAEAEPGEELLLLPYRHQASASPYQASGPIYVRRNARAPFDALDRIPPMQERRLSSVRGYDGAGLMQECDVVAGTDLDATIRRFFGNPEVQTIHVHNARPGCFAFRVERA